MKLEDVEDRLKGGAYARFTEPRELFLLAHVLGHLSRTSRCLIEQLQVVCTDAMVEHPITHGTVVGRSARAAADTHAEVAECAELELFLDACAMVRSNSVAQALEGIQPRQLPVLCNVLDLGCLQTHALPLAQRPLPCRRLAIVAHVAVVVALRALPETLALPGGTVHSGAPSPAKRGLAGELGLPVRRGRHDARRGRNRREQAARRRLDLRARLVWRDVLRAGLWR